MSLLNTFLSLSFFIPNRITKISSLLLSMMMSAIVGGLVLFSFSSIAFTASKSSCAKLKPPELKDVPACDLNPTAELPCARRNNSTVDNPMGSCAETRCDHDYKLLKEEYELKQNLCREWKEEEKEDAEKDEKEEEKQEDALKEMVEKREEMLEKQEVEKKALMEKQEQMAKTKKDKCENSHTQYTSQRDSIEREVREIENEKDQIEDQIRQKRVEIAQTEDKAVQAILRYKQERRKLINQLEDNKDNSIIAFKDQVNKIDDEIDKNNQTLELLDHKFQQIHEKRYAQYLSEYSKCHESAIMKVEKERDERIKYVREYGSYQVVNMEQLFSSGPDSMQTYYNNRIRNLIRYCFKRKTGASSLTSLPEEGATNTKYPTAMQIENELKNNLNENKIQKEMTQANLKKLARRINEVADADNKMMKTFKKGMANLEKDFNDSYEQAKIELERTIKAKGNEILALEQRKARIEESHPHRHFLEAVQLVYRDCCMLGGGSTRCQQLADYSQGLRSDFIKVKSSSTNKVTGRSSTSGVK